MARNSQYPFSIHPDQLAVITQVADDMQVPKAVIIRAALLEYIRGLGYEYPDIEMVAGAKKKNPAIADG